MPIYDIYCEKCGNAREAVILGDMPFCCGEPMKRKIGLPAMIRIKGQGFPSRRKWMDNWTPESPKFSTGSHHGAKY